MIVLVLACCHRERDGWVDERGRAAMGAKPEDVGDDTYQGVWIMPTPERTRAHVFATPDEVAELFAQGAERASQR